MSLKWIPKSFVSGLLMLLISVQVAAVAHEALEQKDHTLDMTGLVEASLDEDSTSLDVDAILSYVGLQAPQNELQQILSRGARVYGQNVDYAVLPKDETDPVRKYYDGEDVASSHWGELGYMHSGMESVLPSTVAANSYVDQLFKKYASLRSSGAIQLPAEFGSLVHYIEGYISQYSRKDTAKKNGISNMMLAVQIVRASFCFGNDPLMITSKIRRETSFSRMDISSGSAVGWSQMTGAGIKEVQDQMSGNSRISMPNARRTFQQAVRCFTGIRNFNIPTGGRVAIQQKLREKWGLDLVFGQIMMKSYVSFTRANGGFSNTVLGNADAYREAFVMYNGDSRPVKGSCVKGATLLKHEYACDIISQYMRMSAQWTRFMNAALGRDRT